MTRSNKIKSQNPFAAKKFRRVLKHNKAATIGAIVLIIFFAAAIFADQIAPFDPLKTSNETFQAPSRKFFFGTDDFGRDIFSGVIYGARTSILVGVSVALFSGLIGVFVGAVSRLRGRRLGRFTDEIDRAFSHSAAIFSGIGRRRAVRFVAF